jgi:hypothetical protein
MTIGHEKYNIVMDRFQHTNIKDFFKQNIQHSGMSIEKIFTAPSATGQEELRSKKQAILSRFIG